MKDFSDAVQLPSGDESIASATIFDAQGHVVRVVKNDHRLRRERWSHVNQCQRKRGGTP